MEGVHRADLVPATAIARSVQRLHVDYFCFGIDLCAAFFCQVKIVEIKRILRAVAATHHAAATAGASGSIRAFAAKERIGKGCIRRLAFGGLKDSNARAVERMAGTRGFADFLSR